MKEIAKKIVSKRNSTVLQITVFLRYSMLRETPYAHELSVFIHLKNSQFFLIKINKLRIFLNIFISIILELHENYRNQKN